MQATLVKEAEANSMAVDAEPETESILSVTETGDIVEEPNTDTSKESGEQAES